MTTSYDIPIVESRAGEAHRIPIQYFFAELLPPLHPKLNADKVLASIRRSGKKGRRPISKGGRWRGFHKDPADGPDLACRKRRPFRSTQFSDVVNTIARAGTRYGAETSFELVHNVVQGVDFERSDEKSLLDALVIPRGSSKDLRVVGMEDVCVAGAYTSYAHKEAQEEVYSRMHRGLLYQLRDHRRRFALGFVVRNTLLEVWYCDKQQVLVSQPFEWITDHRSVIHLFLSILFAEPYQLGLNPTVGIHRGPGGRRQYEFTVEDRDGTQTLYRTVDLLFSNHPDADPAKATYIWKAVEIRDGKPLGDPVVLKDVWRHEELDQEGSNIAAIRRDSKHHDTQDALSQGLLTVLHHGDVIIRSQSNRDPPHLDNLRLHLENVPALARGAPLRDSRIQLPVKRVGPHRGFNGRSSIRGRRIHYRIIFKEVCTPLLKTASIAVICNALVEVSQLLKVLHDSKWVHRDISFNNILVDQDGHARLTDFEFAKKVGDEDIPEFTIGTTGFMSIEVDRQSHSFRPRRFVERIKVYRERRKQKAAAKKAGEPVSDDDSDSDDGLGPSPYPPFFYHPLHDLESLWWLVFFILFRWQMDDSSGATEEQRRRDQERTFTKLFDTLHERRNLLAEDDCFFLSLRELPSHTQAAGRILEKWRRRLVSCYVATEQDQESVLQPVFDGLHDEFNKTMQNICTVLAAAEKESKERVAEGPSKKRSVAPTGRDDDAAPARSAKRRRL